MSRWWRLPFGKVPEIEAVDLKARLDRHEPLQVIDVRTPAEFAGGHIHGAINVPINQFRSILPAVRLLRQAGFSAQQLRGGMISWNRAKFPATQH